MSAPVSMSRTAARIVGVLSLVGAATFVGNPTPAVAAADAARADSGPVGTLPVPAGFPSAVDTGVPSGTTLVEQDGSLSIKTAGTVVRGALIIGCVRIAAPQVTIVDSKIVCGQKKFAIYLAKGSDGAQITDVEVDGTDVATGGIGGKGFTALRVNVHDTADGVHLGDGAMLQDSYIHDLAVQPGLHHDALQTVHGSSASGIQVLGNTLQVVSGTSNGGDVYHIGSGAITDMLVRGNYMDGGGYSIEVANGTGQARIVISGNQFGRDYRIGLINQVAPTYLAVSFVQNTWQDDGTPATEADAYGNGIGHH